MNIYLQKLIFLVIGLSVITANVFSQSYSSSDVQKSLLPHSPDAEALGKFGDIPVGLYTGVPSISIPVYEMKMKGGLTIPISLDYHSSGVKVDETASSVGLDWALNGGGIINQIVYGNNDFYGWFNPAVGYTTPLNGPIQTSFNPVGYSTNQNYIFNTDAATGQIDTQPDMFSFSMPGRSGKFFFDQNQHIHSVPYQNLKIQLVPSTAIAGNAFIITDEHGNNFYFSTTEATLTQTVSCSGAVGSANANISTSIYLTKIITPLNEEVDFNYSAVGYNLQNQIQETRYWYSNINRVDTAQYNYIPNCVATSNSIIAGLQLANITNVTTGEKVIFTYDTGGRLDLPGITGNTPNLPPGPNMLDRIEVFNALNTSVKRFDLTHSYFYSTTPSSSNQNDFRLRLDAVQQYGHQPYVFTYNSTTLPSRLSFAQDHWGNYNGQLGNTTLLPNENTPQFNTGANRNPDTMFMKAGILTSITYPTGGKTAFNYEGNDYYRDHIDTTWNNGSGGGSPSVNATTYYNFTVQSGARNFVASWATSADGSSTGGLSQNGDNTQIVLTGPNNLSINFTGNSSTPQPFQGNGPDGYSLLPGNYTVTVTNSSTSGVAYGGLVIGWIYPVVQHTQQNVLAGGLRIKSTIDYPVTGTGKIKHYEYVNNSNPSRSSGVIQYTPFYDHNYNVYQSKMIGSFSNPSGGVVTYMHVGTRSYLAQSSGSMSPIGSLQGGTVVYSNVNVYDGDRTNGYTSNHFTTLGIFQNYFQGDVPTISPFPPCINNDWLNGLPDTTTNYKYNAASQTYFPISKNTKVYKTAIGDGTNQYTLSGNGVNSNESYVRGVKITYQYPEWVPTSGVLYDNQYFVVHEPASFFVGTYHLYSSWYHLDQEQNTLFDMNGQNPVLTTSNYYYDNPTHIQLTRTVTTKSDGKVLTSATTYPDDYAAGMDFLDNMKTNHIVASPVEHANYLFDGSNTNITDGIIAHYQAAGNGLIDGVYKFETSSPAPLSGFKFSNSTTGQYSFGNSPGTFSMDSRYVSRLTYNHYDNFGNPLMFTQTGGTPVSYQWGYNGMYPVAQAVNAANNDIFYDSFEEGDGNTSDPKTGQYSFNGAYTKALTGLDNGTYSLSYWSKVSGTWTWVVNNAIPVTTGSYTISLASGQYDDIRFYPSTAQMVTYTYLPLIGMTSTTDAKGEITYYEYDGFNRLAHIKDKDGNITKSFCYNYAGQTTGCVVAITYTNVVESGSFTKNNCQSGYASSPVTYTVAAGTYTSSISQADANQKAINDVNTNGQAYANSHGTCTPNIQYVNLYYDTYASGASGYIYAIQFYQNGVLMYTASQSQLLSATPPSIPQGTYTVQVIAGGGSYNSGTGLGYQSFYYYGDVVPYTCYSYSNGNTYSFTLNLTTSTYIYFVIDKLSCGQ